MDYRNWITDKLKDNYLDCKKVKDTFKEFRDVTGNTMSYASFCRRIYEIKEQLEVTGFESQEEVEEYLIKTATEKQKASDLNNVLRKENREGYRTFNLLEAIHDETNKLLKEVDLSKFKLKKFKNKKPKYGIIHLTDHHLNEIIETGDTTDNQYDFDIASKRLKKFISKSIDLLKFEGVTDVYIFFTGDLMNSNRRQSEQLAQITSLVRSSLFATYLYTQAITEVAKVFNVNVAFTVGNESRLTKDMESSDILASENWDYMIFHNLAIIFEKEKNVNFITSEHLITPIISIPNGFNVLLTHGHILKGHKIETHIGKLIVKFLHKGIKINCVLTGHLHNASIGDLLSRGSSLCGSNAYSESDLGFASRPSQNCYTVNEDLSYNGYKIDLGDVSDVEGYDIEDQLRIHNVNRKADATVRVVIENLV